MARYISFVGAYDLDAVQISEIPKGKVLVMDTDGNTVVHPLAPPAIRVTVDVIGEILLRLPVSTLARFRSVCKQWCSIISSPRFIMEHARRAPELLLLFLPTAAGIKAVKPGQAIVFDENWSPSTLVSSSMDTDDHLFASCNGLLCFYRQHTLKIANPVTGDCLHISKPDGILLHDCYYLYSFGFHHVSGEYKLIHFLRELWRYKSGQPFHFDVIQVLTLGEDKWRDIRAPVQCCLVNLGVVSVDGFMYWLTEDEGRRRSGSGMAVMSFDLREETFAPIQPPQLLENQKLSYYLSEVDGKVCLVTTPFHSHVPRWRRYNTEISDRMDVWILEIQTEHNWHLKYSIQSPSMNLYAPQPCFIHREKILLHDREGNASCQDLQDKNNPKIELGREVKLLINFRPHRYYETQGYFYKETLVPLCQFWRRTARFRHLSAKAESATSDSVCKPQTRKPEGKTYWGSGDWE